MEIYEIMLKGWKKQKSLMSCHLLPDPDIYEAKTETGLIKGHAYSVTKVLRAKVDTGNKKGDFPLVRVRNPWGEKVKGFELLAKVITKSMLDLLKEWNGTWSDDSAVWTFVPDEEKVRNIGGFLLSIKIQNRDNFFGINRNVSD